MIINMSGGGGSTELFAAIAATYPEGSICTATNGTEVLTAPNTNGSVIFAIPEPETLPETWTVTSTDGTSSKSETVEITTEGQVESVELSYAFYLFKEGEGLNAAYAVERTRDEDAFVQTTSYIGADNDAMGAMFYLTPKVNLTKYSALKFELKCTGRWGSDYEVIVGVGSNATSSVDEEPTSDVARTSAYSTTRKIYTVDISNINTSYYVKVHGGAVKFYIYNLWLE